MADPYLGEIRMAAFNFPPRGWALCNGTPLPIFQNQALYALLGTRYGGDARNNFNLPDLRARTPICTDLKDFPIGKKDGAEGVSIDINTMPAHNHPFYATSAPGTLPIVGKGADRLLAQPQSAAIPYGSSSNLTPMNKTSCGVTPSSGKAHQNLQPSLVLSFIIALQGTWPPRQ